MKVYKYPINITDFQTIEVRGLHRVLSIGVQYDKLVMWAAVEAEADNTITEVMIQIKGTGHVFSVENIEPPWKFMGSHLMREGLLVWHVWYKLKGK